MKRIILLAGVIALFMGCTNQEKVMDQPSDKSTVIAVQATPIISISEDGPFRDMVVGTAVSNKFYWSNGDQVGVFEINGGNFKGNGNHFVFEYRGVTGSELISAGSNFVAIGSTNSAAKDYLAFCPYSDAIGRQKALDQKSVHFALPDVQASDNNTIDNFGATDFMYSDLLLNFSVGAFNKSAVVFKHAMTWLQFTVSNLHPATGEKQAEVLQSITIKAVDPNIFYKGVLLDATDVLSTDPNDAVTSIALTTNSYSGTAPYLGWLAFYSNVKAGNAYDVIITTSWGTYTIHKNASSTYLPNYTYTLSVNLSSLSLDK